MTFALPSKACRVPGCVELVQPPKRLCPAHWSRVPTDLQTQIADAWADKRWPVWGELIVQAANLVAQCP